MMDDECLCETCFLKRENAALKELLIANSPALEILLNTVTGGPMSIPVFGTPSAEFMRGVTYTVRTLAKMVGQDVRGSTDTDADIAP